MQPSRQCNWCRKHRTPGGTCCQKDPGSNPRFCRWQVVWSWAKFLKFLAPLFFLAVRGFVTRTVVRNKWGVGYQAHSSECGMELTFGKPSFPHSVTPVPFSFWTTQDGKQGQRWLWAVIFLSYLLLLLKHRERILREWCLSLNNRPINLWVPPALAKASAKMPHFPPISCPRLSFDRGVCSLFQKPPAHTPTWTSISHRLLFPVVSSNVTISGGLSTLHIFLCNHRIIRLEETLEIIQLSLPFNSQRNWGLEEQSNLVT